MAILKDIAKMTAIGSLVVVIVSLAVFLTIALGYLFGMFIAILPFVGGWLTDTLPITVAQIPAITAWLAVVGFFIGVGSQGGKKGGE